MKIRPVPATWVILFACLSLTGCAHMTSEGPGSSLQQVDVALFPGLPRTDDTPSVPRFAAPSPRSAAFERLYGRGDEPARAPSAISPLSGQLAREQSAPNLLELRF